jgi:5'-nucleotidase / UDP-sugar diphosphatase
MTDSLRFKTPFRRCGLFVATALTLIACSGGNDANNSSANQTYELNIAHINDSHSNIRPPDTQELLVDGQKVYAPLGGFSRLITLFKSLEGTPNLLKLHSGDAITGTYFYKLFKGRTDAIAMNNICFDAFIPGNHEFDFGDAELKVFLDFLTDQSPTCKTPVLAANIHPGTTPPPASPLISRPDGTPYFVPYIIKNIGGVNVGIIGIDVVGKTKNASKPNASTSFEDEATAAQRTIDQLKNQGVKHIVLMTHIGYEGDLAIAPKLTDVDVIIGGDSHTFLGQYSPTVKKTPAGNYPTIVTNKSGETVCIGQAWEYTKVFARMNIKFNGDGTVKNCSGTASVIVGDAFYSNRDLTTPLSSESNAQVLAKLKAMPEVAVAAEDTAFNLQMQPYNADYDKDAQIQIGNQQGNQSLCLIRVPGTKNRGGSICDPVINLASGSDIAQVVTEGYRKATESSSDPFVADFALTNAGGVRKQLETDGTNDRVLKMEDVFTIQPFPNELIVVQIKGAEMKTALEQGVQNWADNGNSDGSHPYASGLRWDLDLSKPYGTRFTNIEVKSHATGGWSALDPSYSYKLVITDYLRDGAENYTIFKDICLGAGANRCLPVGGVYAADSFADYLKSFAPAKVTRPSCGDYSHQRVIKADGSSLSLCQ